MAVQHVDALLLRKPRDRAAEARPESRLALERRHLDVRSPQIGGPRAFIVEAADGDVEFRPQPPADLDDDALGAAGREAQHDLHHLRPPAGRRRAIVAANRLGFGEDALDHRGNLLTRPKLFTAWNARGTSAIGIAAAAAGASGCSSAGAR